MLPGLCRWMYMILIHLNPPCSRVSREAFPRLRDDQGKTSVLPVRYGFDNIYRMKKSVFWIGVLALIVLAGCKDDPATGGSLTIHFKGQYDDGPLSMISPRPFSGQQQLMFTHLSFYISDLVLNDQSVSTSLKDIELVDLSFDNDNDATEGYTMRINGLTPKTYSGIRFGIGVPQDLNDKKPEDFNSSHPLSNPVNYWQVWGSYIFMKVEGRLDSHGNGAFDTGFAYHTGTNALYRIVDATVPLTIEDGKNKDLEINFDYNTILNGVDIKSMPLNSNPKDTVQIKQILANLASAITLAQ